MLLMNSSWGQNDGLHNNLDLWHLERIITLIISHSFWESEAWKHVSLRAARDESNGTKSCIQSRIQTLNSNPRMFWDEWEQPLVPTDTVGDLEPSHWHKIRTLHTVLSVLPSVWIRWVPYYKLLLESQQISSIEARNLIAEFLLVHHRKM